MLIVMERDMRLTGSMRGQSDAVVAPVGFEGLWQPWSSYKNDTNERIVSSQWKVCITWSNPRHIIDVFYRPSLESHNALLHMILCLPRGICTYNDPRPKGVADAQVLKMDRIGPICKNTGASMSESVKNQKFNTRSTESPVTCLLPGPFLATCG